MNASDGPPLEVGCAEVRAKLDGEQSFVLLDCREPNEHELVHIPQARLLPMSEIQQRLAELEPNRDDEIIVFCHHGMRSLNVVAWLRQQGFSGAKSMAGGIDRWALEIEPGMVRY